jgi:hypothetical protein
VSERVAAGDNFPSLNKSRILAEPLDHRVDIKRCVSQLIEREEVAAPPRSVMRNRVRAFYASVLRLGRLWVECKKMLETSARPRDRIRLQEGRQLLAQQDHEKGEKFDATS